MHPSTGNLLFNPAICLGRGFTVVLQDQSPKHKLNQATDLILVPVPFVLYDTGVYLRSKLQ